MMRRDECFRKIADLRGDAIVVATYSSAFEWRRIAPSGLNYFSVGAMGQASSHALGLALGLPGHKVIVLDGDGSLLMNLGSLVTIANIAPPNLVHFVCHNGLYEVNGEFPLPISEKLSFEGIARESGYAKTWSFSEVEALDNAMLEILTTTGPVFVSLRVEVGEHYPRDYVTIHSAQSRHIFRTALKERLTE